MQILFHLSHPAHFHWFKNVIKSLKGNDHHIYILIKKKDVLEELLDNSGLEYQNILPDGRKDFMVGIAIGQIKQTLRLLRFCIINKPDILVGTSVSITHVGKLLRIPSLIIGEDDALAVPYLANIAYPFASAVVTPDVCKNGRREYKSIKYNGYHELAYLHPNHFSTQKDIAERYLDLNKPYFLLRFSKLEYDSK